MYVPILGNRWSLSEDIHRLQREANRLLGGLAGETRAASFPLTNLYQTKDEVVVTAEVPGVDPTKLSVTVHRSTAIIGGIRPPAATEACAGVHRQERFAGEFVRTIELPCRVDGSAVTAQCKNGVLTVRMPRLAEDKPKSITVTTA